MLMSSVVLHELISGAMGGRKPDAEMLKVQRLLDLVAVVEFSQEDAVASGRVRADLRLRGRPIGDIDTLIVGQALAREWTVVTGNIAHFGRVEGLSLIDWSEGSEPLTPERIATRVAGDV